MSQKSYKSAYLGSDFVRLASYRQQLEYVAREPHQKALLIGKGDGIVPQLMGNMGIEVTVLDVDPELGPDLIGSVEHIPAGDSSYDLCVCCQVLEHLPFDKFQACLEEIKRVTRNRLVLSVPDIRRYSSLRLRIGSLKHEFTMDLPRLRLPVFPIERLKAHGHHWEIGFQGFSLARIQKAIRNAGWNILEYHRVPDLAWHTFFYCKNTTSN